MSSVISPTVQVRTQKCEKLGNGLRVPELVLRAAGSVQQVQDLNSQSGLGPLLLITVLLQEFLKRSISISQTRKLRSINISKELP